MKRWVLMGLAGAAISGMVLAQEGPKDNNEAQIERGRYLVHDVAQCVQCHTPRDSRGTLEERRLLEGARIPVASPYPDMVWAFASPRIAGVPGWTRDEFIALLTTGKRPDAPAPRAPMPTFHMTEEDAAAVYAYLRSLR